MQSRDSDCIAEADGSPMFPEVLRPATGEGIRARLVIPHVGKVLVGAPVVKDVEEAQELPVNPPRGGHDARQKGIGGALGSASCVAQCGWFGAMLN